MSGQWISIQKYSNNNNISISTIRRKIKSGKLKFKVINGKYEIFDTNINHDTLPATSDLSCPIYSKLNEKNSIIDSLKDENLLLKEQISELRMLIKILEEKSGITVSF